MALKTRRSVSLTIFLVTSVLLFFNSDMAQSFESTNLDSFSVKLDTFRFGIDMPNYTDYVDHNTYLAPNVNFDPKAMAGYYHLTKNFINLVLDPNFIKEDMIDWYQSGTQYLPKLSDSVSVNDLLKNSKVLVFVVAIIVVITILTPIVGLLFCCCRCCGNCGAKSEPIDPKRNNNLSKIFQGALIIVLGTLLFISVAFAFSANQQIKEGTHQFPDNIRRSYADGITYVESVEGQATNLLSDNFDQFLTAFNDSVKHAGTNVIEQMESWQNASSMLDLYNFVVALPNLLENLQLLGSNVDNLTTEVKEAESGLSTLKKELLSTLEMCPLPECTSTGDLISSLNFNLNISKIPHVQSAIDELKTLNSGDLKTAAENGKKMLEKLASNINLSLNKVLDDTFQQISETGDIIKEKLTNMTSIVTDVKVQINSANSTLETAYSYITTYSPYFYYGGLAVTCILLLIPICIDLGLILGICGSRPVNNSTNFCTKESGSMFLISAVVLIFIFTIAVGVLTCAMLFFGLAADRAVCYPLRNPTESTIIKIIDDYIAKNKAVNLDLRLSQILTRCSNNQSIYKVFDLAERFNISDLNSKFDISPNVNKMIQEIEDKLKDIIPGTFEILDEPSLAALKEMEKINPDIDLALFESQFNQSNILNNDLVDVIQKLQTLVDVLDSHNLEEISASLKSDIELIEVFNNETLKPIQIRANDTLILAVSINEDLKMNSTSFAEAIKTFLSNVQQAQDQIKGDREQLVTAARSFGASIKELVLGYLNRITDEITDKVGKCGPLNVAVKATIIATCDKIVLPWNSFWVSLFICLLLFIPILIVSVTLASLYRKFKINKEYFAGQRFKIDKNLKKGKMRNLYPDVGSPAAANYPTFRYDDMAPKFNNRNNNYEKSSRF